MTSTLSDGNFRHKHDNLHIYESQAQENFNPKQKLQIENSFLSSSFHIFRSLKSFDNFRCIFSPRKLFSFDELCFLLSNHAAEVLHLLVVFQALNKTLCY